MPKINVRGVDLYYEDTDTDGETMLFSHGLLMNLHMFDDQIAHFKSRFRCIAYDHRGQGRSQVTKRGYDMDTIYEDAVSLIQALDIAPVHFVGLSMGGFVGMRLGARRPDLVRSLVLMETSADSEPGENILRYNLLRFVARWLSLKLIVNGASKSLFGKTFLGDPSKRDRLAHWKKQIAQNDRVGASRAAAGVFTRQSVYEEIETITAPTLIIVGEEDVATVPAKAERIHGQINGSRMVRIPEAGHSASVEQPQAVIEAMKAFYDSIGV
ncbi:MAG: alpha/beta fold hydrolase [Chloroflexota bacterium]